MTDETRFRATKAMAHPQPVPHGTGSRGVRRFEDPLAELARLIGQDDPFADFVATKSNSERRRVSSDAHRPRQEPRYEERDFQAREQEHDEHEAEQLDPKGGSGAHSFVEAEKGDAAYKQNNAYEETGFDPERNGHGDPRPVAPRPAQYRYGQKQEQDLAPQPKQARNRFTQPAQDDYDYPEDEFAQPQRQQRGYGAPQNGHYEQPRSAYAKNGYTDAQDGYYEDDRYSEREAYAEQPRQPKRAPGRPPANPYEAREQRDPRGKQGRNGKGYDADYEDDAHLPAHLDDYYGETPKQGGKKKWILISAAAACILVLGVTGVFGYRAVFGTSGAPKTIRAESTPAKIAPAANTQGAEPGKNNDRVGFDAPPGNERIVSRQEEPVGRAPAQGSSPFAPVPSQSQAPQPQRQQAQAPVAEGEPKRVRTVSVRADGSVVGDQRGSAQRPVSNAPMSINSYAERETGSAPAPQAMPQPQGRAPMQQNTAPAPASGNPWADIQSTPQRAAPQQQASVQPSGPPPVQRAPAPTIAVQTPMPAGSYVVQVASQKTEQEAQAAWQQVQSRYASVLGGQQAQIRRANLGERGTFYRAQLGPFNDRARASEICENLKAAGGECIIQRN
jgi:hypothetical protein